MSGNYKHFEEKEAAEHLRAARAKGTQATAEVHGTEMPGYLSAFADSLKETSILFIGMWILLSQFDFSLNKTLWVLGLFSLGWLFWKLGRSSLLGWARLERLHRLIQQEQWEIEHHRAQEKEESEEGRGRRRRREVNALIPPSLWSCPDLFWPILKLSPRS